MENKEFDIARNVLKLSNRIISNRNKHIKALGITTEQADSLRFFCSHENAGISELKQYLGVTHQTAQGIVRRMAEKGFITMSFSREDGRRREVHVTDAGKKMWERLVENGFHTGEKLLSGLTQEEQVLFSRMIKKAYDNIDEGDD